MIFNKVEDIMVDNVFYRLEEYIRGIDIYLKIEGFNIPGSIKVKPAKFMIDQAEKKGLLNSKSKIIESSSGNLGVSFSHICASKGYPFICVTDVKASKQNIQVMKALGTEVVIIDKPDKNMGYVENRLLYIQDRLSKDKHMLWLNQYDNHENVNSHYELTANALINEFDKIDVLIIGSGTSGTLMGCIKKFQEKSPQTKIIAVDTVGSITFSDTIKKRYLPGLGASRKPEICESDLVENFIAVDEVDAVIHCNRLARKYGLLAGASTGSVLAAIATYAPMIKKTDVVVTFCADWGRSYLDTVYEPSWYKHTFHLEDEIKCQI